MSAEPMSSLDASFLHMEDRNKHMHIGGVSIFEGPPPEFERLEEMVSGKLGLVPRYRQKVRFVPLGLGRPLWELWMVEGLSEDRWALLSKVHHCMVDGVAATDLMSMMFDDSSAAAAAGGAARWDPAPEPRGAELVLRMITRRTFDPREQLR